MQNELKNASEIILDLLQENKRTRDSDTYLIYCVYRVLLRKKGIDVDSIPFGNVLLSQKEYGLPNFETIRRVRQKLQAKFPILCSSADIDGFRKLNEEEVRQWARK